MDLVLAIGSLPALGSEGRAGCAHTAPALCLTAKGELDSGAVTAASSQSRKEQSELGTTRVACGG